MTRSPKVLMSAISRFLSQDDAAFSGASLQEMMRRNARRILPRLGWPGIIAISILAICPPFFFSTIRPMQERLNVSQRMENALHEQAMNGGKPLAGTTTPSEELEEFYKHFPSERNSPHWLGRLVEVAESNGLSLNHGEYNVNRDKVGRLIRFRITLPVQGKYTQVRKFLSSLNSEIPIMALENVQFQRKDVLDTDVQVNIKLLLYMVQDS
jgi:Tfp pilus assembly protein PilO